MAIRPFPYEVRSIRDEDVDSTGAACFAAFDGLSQRLHEIENPDFENVANATAVVRSKVSKLSHSVTGIVAVGTDGKVLGGCFGEVMG
jgi:hypothetical protein